jgi:hypothetical protein
VACAGELAAGVLTGYFILARSDHTMEVCPVCVPCGDGDFEQLERWIRARQADVIDRRYFVHSSDEDG